MVVNILKKIYCFFVVVFVIGGGYVFLSWSEKLRRVNVALEVPVEMEPLLFGVMYRSEICKRKRLDGDFNAHYEDGYRYIEIIPKQRKESTIYYEDIVLDKGGYCKWKLSNVTIGFQYKKGADIMNGVSHSRPAKIVFIFDNHRPQLSSIDNAIKISNNLVIEEDFYPLKKEYPRDKRPTIISIESEKILYI
ncbi:hypothetical protein [Pragia fontium]|uniref:hypothetical protein n=1 Tax=Pragia fontium TaxID=82985 RepID=UPI00064AF55F|nr:hypothetical protein [Pragia fontium]AKJ43186.1 hypothetical protein QQ39_14840 [Pragia fontium]